MGEYNHRIKKITKKNRKLIEIPKKITRYCRKNHKKNHKTHKIQKRITREYAKYKKITREFKNSKKITKLRKIQKQNMCIYIHKIDVHSYFVT